MLPGMAQTRITRIATGAAAIGVVAVIIGTVWAFGASTGAAEPEPSPSASVAAVDFSELQANVQQVIDGQVEAARLEAERVAAEAQAAADAEAARVAAEQAAADAAAAEAARQTAKQNANSGSTPTTPVQASPVRCPAGSTANSSDGINDTSCFPDICFTITVPDPAHPECDTAFRP